MGNRNRAPVRGHRVAAFIEVPIFVRPVAAPHESPRIRRCALDLYRVWVLAVTQEGGWHVAGVALTACTWMAKWLYGMPGRRLMDERLARDFVPVSRLRVKRAQGSGAWLPRTHQSCAEDPS
jgi:hypothetical protein